MNISEIEKNLENKINRKIKNFNYEPYKNTMKTRRNTQDIKENKKNNTITNDINDSNSNNSNNSNNIDNNNIIIKNKKIISDKSNTRIESQRGVVYDFLKALYDDAQIIAKHWNEFPLDKNKNLMQNLEDLFYLIFVEKMEFGIDVTLIHLFKGKHVLKIPIILLSEKTQQFIRFFKNEANHFFIKKESITLTLEYYYEFKFDDILNESPLKYKIVSWLFISIMLHDQENNSSNGRFILSISLNNIIQRFLDENLRSKISNSIFSPKDRNIESPNTIRKISNFVQALEKADFYIEHQSKTLENNNVNQKQSLQDIIKDSIEIKELDNEEF